MEKISWQPAIPVPREFEDVLSDGEEEDGDDIIIEVLKEGADNAEMILPDMPVYYVQNDGRALVPLYAHEQEEGDPLLTSDSEDEAESTAARRRMIDSISPLTVGNRSPTPVQSSAPERFQIEVIQPPFSRRGRVSARGRGRGRGRSRIRGGISGERGWMRGEPLQEIYVDNAELPEQLREDIRDISRLLAGRVNAQQTMNVEEERVVDNDDMSMGENLMMNEDDMSEGFVWRPLSDWNGVKESFLPETTGPTRLFDNAYEALHSIWTDDIMSHIAVETNRYAQSLAASRPRFERDWYETNPDEIWVLFGFWLMLGIIKMPTIKSCFTKIPILQTDIFRRLFNESRYWDLNAAFHLVEGADPNNPLHLMGPILEHLNAKFQELYRLNQEICIDESITLWKGPGGFKQYIKSKAANMSIKTYKLCESATGYLWSFFVYIGRGINPSSMPSSVQTVQRLMRPLLHLGHTLYMDNWFNSPMLARWLKQQQTDCVGTLRTSRKHVPLEIQRCPLPDGQFIARASENVMVVAIQDLRRVTCLSTYHDVSQVRKDSGQFKLQLIDDYNKNMGGVDRLDQMLEPYKVERKTSLKWTKKLFKHLLNVSVQNARILVEKSTETKIDSLAFRLAVVQAIVDRHLSKVPRRPCGRPLRPRPERLTERHFLRRIPITDKMREKIKHRTSLGRRNCVWCTRNGRRNSKTVYECTECNVPLCLESCFREYHTIE